MPSLTYSFSFFRTVDSSYRRGSGIPERIRSICSTIPVSVAGDPGPESISIRMK